MNNLPHVTIVFAARTEQEAQELIRTLEAQKYSGSLSYSYSTEGNIAHALNKAIQEADGELLIFTETDVRPINERWIVDMVNSAQKGQLVKGVEFNQLTANWATMAVYKQDLRGEKIDEAFEVAEDTEFFARLKTLFGIQLIINQKVVVSHLKDPYSDKAVQRAYTYGRNEIRIMRKYNNYDPVQYRRRIENQLKIAQETLRGIDDEIAQKPI